MPGQLRRRSLTLVVERLNQHAPAFQCTPNPALAIAVFDIAPEEAEGFRSFSFDEFVDVWGDPEKTLNLEELEDRIPRKRG